MKKNLYTSPADAWRESFSNAAQDWLTIYSWAVAWGTGERREDVMKRLIVECFKRAARRGNRSEKINLRTAEAVVADVARSYDSRS